MQSKVTKLSLVTDVNDVGEPTHIVKCSGTREHAYVLSLTSNKMHRRSWLGANDGQEDREAVDAVNDALPKKCSELAVYFTAKYGKVLSEFYVGDDCVFGAGDNVVFRTPDSIFVQRFSPKFKTFDMIFFYGKDHVMFNMVDKSDLPTIRDWYSKKIYSCGLDPVPMNAVAKLLEEYVARGEVDIYEKVFEDLFSVESEASESDYEPSDVESESEEESDLASEDEDCLTNTRLEEESGYDDDEEDNEEEVEEDDRDGDGGDWKPTQNESSDEDEEGTHRSTKRQKI